MMTWLRDNLGGIIFWGALWLVICALALMLKS
jgi:hypothetical protein